MIFYEAPHRLVRTLEVLSDTFGEDRRAALCRELTKKHETLLRLPMGALLRHFRENEPKGECVLVVEGRNPKEAVQEAQQEWETLSVAEHVAFYVSGGMDRKEAMKQAAKDRGLSKREIYARLLEEERQE